MKPYVPEVMTFTDACEKSKESYRKYRSRLTKFSKPPKNQQASRHQVDVSRRIKLNFLFIIFIF
jgi:hypothetical protein